MLLESALIFGLVMRYDPYAPIGIDQACVAGRTLCRLAFQDVKVVLRSSNGNRAWMVQVDISSPWPELLPDLVQTLPIDGEPGDYDLINEGSIDRPILVLIDKNPGRVGKFMEISPDNE